MFVHCYIQQQSALTSTLRIDLIDLLVTTLVNQTQLVMIVTTLLAGKWAAKWPFSFIVS